jgi:cellulose synthase/poly-beta-1,6-N-acetylglucosamine synthase-like glycosyltransferase
MIWLALAVTGLWLWLAWHDFVAVRALPDLPPLPPDTERRAVTAVMPVRDDADRLAGAFGTLLGQQHIDLTLVVVDDRSRDSTADLLAEMAAHDNRVHVHTVHELPPDWLGKSHALFVGTADIATRWILFTDSDARLSADALARAIAAAEREDAQHVCLMPTHRQTTFIGRVVLLAFQLMVQRRVLGANRDQKNAFVGIGAFNLVRTDAYRDVGGHEPLRLGPNSAGWTLQ